MRTQILALAMLAAAAIAVPAHAQEDILRIERGPITNLSEEAVQALEDSINRVIDGLRGSPVPNVHIDDPRPGARDLAGQRDWPPDVLAIIWGANISNATIDIGRPRTLSLLPNALRDNRFAPLRASADFSVYEVVLLYAVLVRTWQLDFRRVPIVMREVTAAIERAKERRLGGSTLRCLLRIEAAAAEVRRKATRRPPSSLPLPIMIYRPCATAH